MAEKNPTLAPEKVRAVLTTKWTKAGYRPITVRSIESYVIESNLDQDSDAFSMVIGDHENALNALLNRDGEIRVQLFGVGLDVSYLLTGIVDDLDKGEDGRITITGRDNSSIATDTTALAGRWIGQKADKFIEKRARELGVTTRFNLAPGPSKKVVKTDGSESEWEFWYRLIRKEGQWLWFTSDGWLTSGRLNYQASPEYFFGTNPVHVSSQEFNKYVPIEKITYKKTTQSRVAEVILFYHSGGRIEALPKPELDGTLDGWMRRPLKYVEDKHVHTKPQAIKAAREEIFEGMVGALEIQITIPDLGRIIRQNRVARLNVPELDLQGDWFVVGSRITADESGFMQEVRLREKNYAISKRVPILPDTPSQPSSDPDDIGACESLCDVIPRWCQFFIDCAHKYRSALAFDHFLAVLCAICDRETGGSWKNVRNNGGPRHVGVEYFEWDGTPRHGIESLVEWKWAFGNEPGIYSGGQTLAVGPMQLYTLEYKERADRFNDGKIDEFFGNRWLPQANIMTAGWVLTEGKANGSLREDNLWSVVAAYGEGKTYADAVRRAVAYTWLPKIQKAISTCGEAGKFTVDPDLLPSLNAQAAAKELLRAKAQGWFDGQAQAIGDVETTAAGKSFTGPCGNRIAMNASILNGLLFLINNGFSIYIWTLATGHDCYVEGSNRQSRHSVGYAADIARIGTKAHDFSHIVGDQDKSTTANIKAVLKAFRELPVGDRPDQTICNGNGQTDNTIRCLQLNNHYPTCEEITGGHRDHVHVGY